jgi:hypothetical protein
VWWRRESGVSRDGTELPTAASSFAQPAWCLPDMVSCATLRDHCLYRSLEKACIRLAKYPARPHSCLESKQQPDPAPASRVPRFSIEDHFAHLVLPANIAPGIVFHTTSRMRPPLLGLTPWVPFRESLNRVPPPSAPQAFCPICHASHQPAAHLGSSCIQLLVLTIVH